MVAAHTPTVIGRHVALRLRALREATGLSFADVERLSKPSGNKIGEQKVRRIERAEVRPERTDIETLLGIYGVPYAEAKVILEQFDLSWQSGWWLSYPDIVVGPFVSFEREAEQIRTWQPYVFPGLFQTDAYAWAMVTAGMPHISEEEAERRVRVRAERRTVVTGKAPQIHAVLGEAALRQAIGGEDVMRRQLRHLLEVAELPNVTLQVLPFSARAHAGLTGPSVILSFAEGIFHDVVYVDGPGAGWYGETERDLEVFTLLWGDVADAALPPEDSVAIVAALA